MKKRGLLGKVLIGIIALAVIGAVFGGGKTDDTAKRAPETPPADPVKPAVESPEKKAVSESDFIGTWKASGIYDKDNNYYSLAMLESAGNTNLTDMYMVIYGNRILDLIAKGDVTSGNWSVSGSRLTAGTGTFVLEDGRLSFEANGETVVFEKTSNTAERPALAASSPESPAPSQGGTSEPAPEAPAKEEAPQKDKDSISPELKAFLESYEAFVDEYCAFMKNYDASDMSQLSAYMSLLQRDVEMTQKAEEWDEKDMNNAETLYYVEVMNRCSEKLLKAGLSM